MSVDEDYWLIPTLNFDYRIDEYVTAQERLSSVLETHKGIKCPGLTQAWACSVCFDEYGTTDFGKNLKYLLDRIETEQHRERKTSLAFEEESESL